MTDIAASWRTHRWALGAYLVLGALRLPQPLDVSEAIALTRTGLSMGDWVRFSPGHLLLLDLWSRLADSALWLHAFGWLVGLVALLLAPRALRGLGGVHASGGAMWFLCCAPLLVQHVVRVSPSALALASVVVSTLCFVEFLRAGQRSWLAGWLATSLAALSLHGGLYVLPLLQSATMLLTRERTHARQRDWWVAQILPLLGFLWLYLDPLTRFVTQRIGQIAGPRQILEGIGRLGAELSVAAALAVTVLLLFLVLSGWRNQGGPRRDPKRWLLWTGWIVPGAVWLLWLPYPFYALMAAPFLACVISAGIRSYPQWARQILWTAIFAFYAWGHWGLWS